MVLLTEISHDRIPRMKPIPYNEDVHGKLTYPHALRFLYLVHKKFFEELLKHTRTSIPEDFSIDEFFEPHFSHFPELLQLPSMKEDGSHEDKRYNFIKSLLPAAHFHCYCPFVN